MGKYTDIHRFLFDAHCMYVKGMVTTVTLVHNCNKLFYLCDLYTIIEKIVRHKKPLEIGVCWKK